MEFMEQLSSKMISRMECAVHFRRSNGLERCPREMTGDISKRSPLRRGVSPMPLGFRAIRGETTPTVDSILVPRLTAPEYEELCYPLNQSGTQNGFYGLPARSRQIWGSERTL